MKEKKGGVPISTPFSRKTCSYIAGPAAQRVWVSFVAGCAHSRAALSGRSRKTSAGLWAGCCPAPTLWSDCYPAG